MTQTIQPPAVEARKMSRALLWFSAVIWAAGFFVTYLLGPILERMDRS